MRGAQQYLQVTELGWSLYVKGRVFAFKMSGVHRHASQATYSAYQSPESKLDKPECVSLRKVVSGTADQNTSSAGTWTAACSDDCSLQWYAWGTSRPHT